MQARLSGYLYTSTTDYGPMAHAQLFAGESNSGKLVTSVRARAQELAKSAEISLILVDGPPGTGLIVAEPTVPAIHDLERTLQLFTHFQIPAMVVINKFDLNQQKTKTIETYCTDHGIEIVGRLPYDTITTEAIVAGRPVVEHAPKQAISQKLNQLWKTIEKQLAFFE
jgi:MinD superfamily P-loop ATPase